MFNRNNPYWLDQSGSDYVPRYGAVGVTLVEDTMAQEAVKVTSIFD